MHLKGKFMFRLKLYLITFFILSISNFCLSQNYYEEGMKQYFNGNDDNKSIELFTKAIENSQEVSKALMMRGAAKIQLKKYSDALLDLNSSMRIDSNYYKTYFYYGRLYFIQGFYQSALKYYSLALAKNPKDSDSYNERAASKGKLGDFKGAIQDEDSAIYYNPKDAEYYCNRGYAKFELNKPDEAINDYNTSIHLQPTASAYCNRGIAFAAKQNHSNAIQDYTKAIEMNPDKLDFYYYRGLSYKKTNEKNAACADFVKSAKMGFPPAVDEHNKLCKP